MYGEFSLKQFHSLIDPGTSKAKRILWNSSVIKDSRRRYDGVGEVVINEANDPGIKENGMDFHFGFVCSPLLPFPSAEREKSRTGAISG